MNNFMIGQFNTFDYTKFHRDFRQGFYGIEACSLKSEEDINALILESERCNSNIGIHFPLRAGLSKLRDAKFMSLDKQVRENAFEIIEEELRYIRNKGFRPEYILFHYPKPVILDNRVDWSDWRFADRSEYEFEGDYPFEEFVKSSEYLFEWLSSKGREYDFIPVLEFDAINRYIYDEEFLEDLLVKYPNIKLCLDFGRFHYQDLLDKSINSREIIKRFSKYTYLIHLWNVKLGENKQNNHYPVLPRLKPEEGWAPVEDFIKILKEEDCRPRVLFEHRSELINDEELEECYLWIDNLLNS